MKLENLDPRIKTQVYKLKKEVYFEHITPYNLICIPGLCQCTTCGKIFDTTDEGDRHIRKEHFDELKEIFVKNARFGKEVDTPHMEYLLYDNADDLKTCELYEQVYTFNYKPVEDYKAIPLMVNKEDEVLQDWNMQINVGKDKLGQKIDEMVCSGIPICDIRVDKNSKGNYVLRRIVRKDEE